MTTPRIDLEQEVTEHLPERVRRWVRRVDDAVAGFFREYGIACLRIALGLVFVWFGMLKVTGRSPVEDLVAGTVYWVDGDFFVHFLGVWEIIVGVGLLIPVALRLTLLLFWAQMAGTFLVLIVHPGLSFE